MSHILEQQGVECDVFQSDKVQLSIFAYCTGGRGVVVGPILSPVMSDVFCDNENGPNFLFKNNGDGTFVDMAKQAGVCHREGKQVESL